MQCLSLEKKVKKLCDILDALGENGSETVLDMANGILRGALTEDELNDEQSKILALKLMRVTRRFLKEVSQLQSHDPHKQTVIKDMNTMLNAVLYIQPDQSEALYILSLNAPDLIRARNFLAKIPNPAENPYATLAAAEIAVRFPEEGVSSQSQFFSRLQQILDSSEDWVVLMYTVVFLVNHYRGQYVIEMLTVLQQRCPYPTFEWWLDYAIERHLFIAERWEDFLEHFLRRRESFGSSRN